MDGSTGGHSGLSRHGSWLALLLALAMGVPVDAAPDGDVGPRRLSPSAVRWERIKDLPRPTAPADPRRGAFTIEPFTVVGYDVPTQTLVKFDESGAFVDSLPVPDTL